MLFMFQVAYMPVWFGPGKPVDLRTAVRNVFVRLGTAALWTEWSLTGAKGKKSLEKTKIFHLVKGALLYFYCNSCHIIP